jgi:hypothetical protein
MVYVFLFSFIEFSSGARFLRRELALLVFCQMDHLIVLSSLQVIALPESLNEGHDT